MTKWAETNRIKFYPKDDSSPSEWSLYAGIGWGTVMAIEAAISEGMGQGKDPADILVDVLEILER